MEPQRLTTYSADILNKIEEYAQKLTPIEDIAVLLDLRADDLRSDISDKESIVSLRYRRGKAKCELLLRSNEIDMAEAGSPQAILNMRSYLQKMSDDEFS